MHWLRHLNLRLYLIKVYKNISDGNLKFELIVSPYLTSYQGGGYTNIYVTYADYPGISDIDNDGADEIICAGRDPFIAVYKYDKTNKKFIQGFH